MKLEPIVADPGHNMPSPQGRDRLRSTNVAILFAMLIGLAFRLTVGWSKPLWFDETFSAAIAVQRDVPHLVAWCLTELGGPVYYGFLFLWEKIAGDGDTALRLPSLVFSLAGPLLLLARGHPDRRVRLFWAALLALWLPALPAASSARPYALLVLLTSAQAIAFLAMMRRPGTGRALVWSAISALAILCHYYALVIAALQAACYLGDRRGEALRSWPAVLAFVPPALWMWWHFSFLMGFTQPNVAWQGVLQPRLLPYLPVIAFGIGWPAGLLCIAIAGSWASRAAEARRGGRAFPYRSGEMLLVASGVGAFALVITLGFLTPSFNPRYVLPYGPAILFGLAIWLREAEKRWPLAGLTVLACMSAAACAQMAARIADPFYDAGTSLNFEQPSAWLRAHGVRRLVLLWDNPTMAITSDDHIGQAGGFFLRRDGGPAVPLSFPRLPTDADPNPLLIRAAAASGTGILWLYDDQIHDTRGARYPARIDKIDPRWQCHDFGRAPAHSVACMR